MHFNHTFPPLILHYLLVHPTLCSFSPPSLKRKSNKTKTKNPNKLKKKIRQKNTRTKQKAHNQTMESTVCRPPTPGQGALPQRVAAVLPEELFSLSQQVSNANGFWVRGGALRPVPLSSAWILFGQNLCRSQACSRSLCEFVCANSLLCLEKLFHWGHPPPLALVFSPPPLSNRYHCILRGRI